MLARREPEIDGRPDLLEHHVGCLIPPVRHIGCKHVGQAFEDQRDLGAAFGRAGLQALHLAPQRGRLRLGRTGVSAVAAPDPYLLAERVAARLLLLQGRLHRAAFEVVGQNRLGFRRHAAPRESGIEARGIGADGP